MEAKSGLVFYTRATLLESNHGDIAIIAAKFSDLGIFHRCTAQTVITDGPLTNRQAKRYAKESDDWGLSGDLRDVRLSELEDEIYPLPDLADCTPVVTA
jgi:hypothetical protein